MIGTIEVVTRGLLAGIGGAALMDVWALVARRTLGIRGLDYTLLGRWIGHLRRRRFFHQRIAAAEPIRGERAIGWGAHYTIGVAFAFLLLTIWGGEWTKAPTLWPALAVGWGTLVAPWLVMQPAMGAGIAGSHTPHPGAGRLRNFATHTVYGIGLYATAALLAAVWR